MRIAGAKRARCERCADGRVVRKYPGDAAGRASTSCMEINWSAAPTNSHQDHVIAHVVGATVVGYFRADDSLHILLDIGFVWTIFLDGEMGLLPKGVAVADLDAGEAEKNALQADIESLLDGLEGDGAPGRIKLVPAPIECLIEEVEFYAGEGERRKIIIRGTASDLVVETSPAAREIFIAAINKEVEA